MNQALSVIASAIVVTGIGRLVRCWATQLIPALIPVLMLCGHHPTVGAVELVSLHDRRHHRSDCERASAKTTCVSSGEEPISVSVATDSWDDITNHNAVYWETSAPVDAGFLLKRVRDVPGPSPIWQQVPPVLAVLVTKPLASVVGNAT